MPLFGLSCWPCWQCENAKLCQPICPHKKPGQVGRGPQAQHPEEDETGLLAVYRVHHHPDHWRHSWQAYFVPWSAFWQCIKNTRKDYTGVATLKVNGTIINDTKKKADQLNKHFESVFTHENTVQPDLLPNASPYPVAPEADGTCPRLTYHAPW